MSANVWQRFRLRLMEGNDQDQYLKDWAILRELTLTPQNALERLRDTVAVDKMSESSYQHFRKSMVLVNAAYSNRAGLIGISDPEEWQKRYSAYLAGTDPEATQYDAFWILRSNIDSIRKPPEQETLFSPAELRLGEACNELFAGLAILLNQAGPGSASETLIGGLRASIAEYEELLKQADAANRSRRQALDAIAEAQYAAGRTSLILRKYDQARQWFESALESFLKLGDEFGVRSSRVQLSALRILATGDVDGSVRANLETLTRKKTQAGSLDQAKALVSQLIQTVTAGDRFAATRLLQEAVQEMEQQQYLSDQKFPNLEAALLAWIENVPAELKGNYFLNQLVEVVKIYAAICGARASLNVPGADERIREIAALVHQLGAESLKADDELQRRFAFASARPLAAPQPAADV